MDKKFIRNIMVGVLFICIAAMISLLLFRKVFMNESDKKVVYVHGKMLVDPNDKEALVGFSDCVFVGRIESALGNKQPKEGEFSIPYNEYKVQVIENIKGELKDEVTIKKLGGYTEDGTLMLLQVSGKDDALPEVGATYIFIAGVQDDGQLVIDNAYSQIRIDSQENEKHKAAIEKYKKAVKKEKKYIRKRFDSKYLKN